MNFARTKDQFKIPRYGSARDWSPVGSPHRVSRHRVELGPIWVFCWVQTLSPTWITQRLAQERTKRMSTREAMGTVVLVCTPAEGVAIRLLSLSRTRVSGCAFLCLTPVSSGTAGRGTMLVPSLVPSGLVGSDCSSPDPLVTWDLVSPPLDPIAAWRSGLLPVWILRQMVWLLPSLEG